LQLSLTEAQKNNDAKIINRYKCLINCYNNEKSRQEKLKLDHVKILNQYKNDEEERDEKINQLLQTSGIPKACECD
jgi:hypothetical protein